MDEQELRDALRGLPRRGADLRQTLPLIAAAFSSGSSDLEELADSRAFFLVDEASPDDVEWLESLVGSPELGFAARVLALNYYFRNQETEGQKSRQREHIFWIIENAPASKSAGRPPAHLIRGREDKVLYKEFHDRWLAAVAAHPKNPAVLVNAALGLQLHDDQLAERLLQQAIELDPDSPWPRRWLAHLYLRRARSKNSGSVAARMAQEQLTEILTRGEARPLDPSPEGAAENQEDAIREAAVSRLLSRLRTLPDLSCAAFAADDLDAATAFAIEALTATADAVLPEFFRHDGQVTHHCNLVLGRIALQRGDVAEARRRLLDAGRTKGSPPLNSFGPNMQLAEELLLLGEKDVVLEYFELCRNFWKLGGDRLDIWAQKVRAGRPPMFGANLRY